MKKGLIIISGLIICFGIYLLYAHKIKESKSIEKEKPLNVDKDNEPFTNSLQATLNQYYKMHNALVNWDSLSVKNSIVDSLIFYTNNIQFKELKADPLLLQTAKNYANSIVTECNAMKNVSTIVEQRKSFYIISEALFDLLRTVQYNRATIYHVLCPMAFGDNDEGYWLADKREIINPYLGNKDPKYRNTMLHCGSIEDSINFK